MFDRTELLQSKEYWLTRIQTNLYNLIKEYIETNGMTRTDLAKHLGVSKGYVTQIMNGDFDHRLSKLIELSLAINKAPNVIFEDIDKILEDDQIGLLYEGDHEKRPIINIHLSFEPYLDEIKTSSKSVKVNRNFTAPLQSSDFTDVDSELV